MGACPTVVVGPGVAIVVVGPGVAMPCRRARSHRRPMVDRASGARVVAKTDKLTALNTSPEWRGRSSGERSDNQVERVVGSEPDWGHGTHS
jgi:hypothetical protein